MNKDARPGAERQHKESFGKLYRTADSRCRDIILKSFSIYDTFLYYALAVLCQICECFLQAITWDHQTIEG